MEVLGLDIVVMGGELGLEGWWGCDGFIWRGCFGAFDSFVNLQMMKL